jgi:hypothetical protein
MKKDPKSKNKPTPIIVKKIPLRIKEIGIYISLRQE